MASGYPAALDTLATNKTDATPSTTDHAAHHNDLADAINKIEAELGVDPSGSYTSVVNRLNGELTCRKTADQSNSTTTPANITDMVFPVTVGADHTFEFTLAYSSAATGTGIAFDLTVPALGSGGYIAYDINISKGQRPAVGVAPSLTTVNYVGAGIASGNEIGSDSVTAANTVYIARITGILSNPSAAGSIQVQFRSEVASTAVTLKKGSSGIMRIN